MESVERDWRKRRVERSGKGGWRGGRVAVKEGGGEWVAEVESISRQGLCSNQNKIIIPSWDVFFACQKLNRFKFETDPNCNFGLVGFDFSFHPIIPNRRQDLVARHFSDGYQGSRMPPFLTQ